MDYIFLQLNIVKAYAQELHFLDHFGQFLFEKLLAHLLEDNILGLSGDEIADAALVVDDARIRLF